MFQNIPKTFQIEGNRTSGEGTFCIKYPSDGKNAVKGSCDLAQNESTHGKNNPGRSRLLHGGGVEQIDSKDTGALFYKL